MSTRAWVLMALMMSTRAWVLMALIMGCAGVGAVGLSNGKWFSGIALIASAFGWGEMLHREVKRTS